MSPFARHGVAVCCSAIASPLPFACSPLYRALSNSLYSSQQKRGCDRHISRPRILCRWVTLPPVALSHLAEPACCLSYTAPYAYDSAGRGASRRIVAVSSRCPLLQWIQTAEQGCRQVDQCAANPATYYTL